MKFKEIYIGDDLNLSLGRFYNTDIRKLVAFQLDYPRLFSDQLEDPSAYFTERVRAPDSLYFALRYRKKVIAYGALDPIGKGLATMHLWRRKWERTKKQWLIGLARLMAEFSFKEMGFRRLTMAVPDFADTAASLIRDTGFTQEGILRNFATYEGTPTNMVVFGMLKEEL